MFNRLVLIAFAASLLLPIAPQSFGPAGSPSQETKPATSGGAGAVPGWLPLPVPPALYEKWRKYGPWDYKQQAFEYRDFTLFNFGATGSAAGFSQQSLMALMQASKPRPSDLDDLDDPQLLANFSRNAELLDRLREMAEQDAHLIRIASDFTWLDNDSAWPRKQTGFSEARWNEYRALFKKLSLPEGIVRTKDFPGAIFFIARARGLCTGGSSAGYVYSTKPLVPVVESAKEALDTEARKNPGKHFAYAFRSMGEDWYAFYEMDW